MAGAGAKKFPAFSKLASDDVNNYLADQVIMRFATTTARDAAFGGVGEPTLAEGMTAYIDADNTMYTYDGSNWIKMVSASQPVGLWLVKSQTIGTGVSSVTVTGAFSADYDNYLITISGGVSSSSGVFGLRLGSVSSNYRYQFIYGSWTNTVQADGTIAGGLLQYAGTLSGGGLYMNCVLQAPFRAESTRAISDASVTGSYSGTMTGLEPSGTQHTDFTIVPSSGTITGGTIYVYGYRK